MAIIGKTAFTMFTIHQHKLNHEQIGECGILSPIDLGPKFQIGREIRSQDSELQKALHRTGMEQIQILLSSQPGTGTIGSLQN